MLCCAALILVLGLCRAAWVYLRRSGPGSGHGSEPGFAPPARRPAPGR